MKKLTDEEIQKIIEDQQYDKAGGQGEEEDLHAYRLLFEALDEAPADSLSLHFADRVAHKALIQAEQRQNLRYLLLQLLSISVAWPVSIVLLFIYQPVIYQQLSGYLYENRWIVIFSVLMYTLIQIVDYGLVRSRKNLALPNQTG